MKTYITGLAIVATVTLSCCGQKAASDTDENLKNDIAPEETFDSAGYTAGTIIQTKFVGDCEWLIQLKNGDLIETMEMNKNFLSSGKKVWLKYTPQRRMQRCDNAAPVAITAMVGRD